MMDTKQLDDARARLFVDEGKQIVFWRDPAQAFLDFRHRLPLGKITARIEQLADDIAAASSTA